MCACCCKRKGRKELNSVVPEPESISTKPLAASVDTGGETTGDDTSTSAKETVAKQGTTPHMDRLGSKLGAQGKPFPKRPLGCKLSQAIWDKLEDLFRKMDPDGSNAVTKEEARLFFKGAFGKLSADAMFNEVDVDGSGAIDADEFVAFWIHVRKNGYKEQDIIDELDELLEGGAWVDWKDGRNVNTNSNLSFPKRPMLCRLGQATWNKCRELFEKIDHDSTGFITIEKANKHFTVGFSKMSADAMFKEIDQNHHGQISAKEWMKFWVQVKSSGYKTEDINEELDNLLQGNPWVDWKDGRSTT